MDNIYELVNNRFSNENIEVVVKRYNDDNFITLHERTKEGHRVDPVALVYEKDYEMLVEWYREADLSDYQRNRLEFQLYHLVKEFSTRAQRYKRIHGGVE